MSLRCSIFLMVTAFALTIPGTRGQENLLSLENALAIARAINTAEVEFLDTVQTCRGPPVPPLRRITSTA